MNITSVNNKEETKQHVLVLVTGVHREVMSDESEHRVTELTSAVVHANERHYDILGRRRLSCGRPHCAEKQ